MERFTRREVLRILNISAKQLAYWERLRLVEPRTGWGEEGYRFGGLISPRPVERRAGARVPARRRGRAVEARREQLAGVEAPPPERRIVSDGRTVAVELDGRLLEPI